MNASAKTYFVAPTGKDTNPGTFPLPWGTWQKAFETAMAGDTVYFRGGVYFPTKMRIEGDICYVNVTKGIGHDGTYGNPVCYFAYPADFEQGNFPILDCSLIDVGQGHFITGVTFEDSDYIKLKGLTIRNVYQRYSGVRAQGLYFPGCTNIHCENMTIHNIGGRAICLLGGWINYRPGHVSSDTIKFINCDLYTLCDSLYNMPGMAPPELVGNLADGIKIDTEPYGYILIDGCRFWHISDNAIDNSGGSLLEVKNCWAFRIGDFEFTNADGKYLGEGIAIKFGSNEVGVKGPHRIIHHNLTAYNGFLGFDENQRPGNGNIDGYIYNNTSFKDNISFGNFSCNYNDLPFRNRYFNNISFKPKVYPRGDEAGDIIEGYNSWKDYDYSWSPASRIPLTENDFQSLDSTQLYWSRNPDGSLPNITFLKLAPTSEAINAGTSKLSDTYVLTEFKDSAPDIGYSEYSSDNNHISPKIISSIINYNTPSRIEITFNLPLAIISIAQSAFTVNVNSETRTISTVVISSNKVILTLTTPVKCGDSVSLSYSKPSANALQTTEGEQIDSFTAQRVSVECPPTTNQSPSVSISSPTKSNSFYSPATIVIDATANDPDGSVIKVEFFNGMIKLGERTIAPYSFTWKEVSAGTYSVTAAATDNSGSKTVSTSVSVTVLKSSITINQLPEVTIKSPGNGKKYKKNEKIVIEVEASDPDGTISKIELKSNNSKLAELTSAPYIFVWEGADTGSYYISAIATDNLGATSNSSEIEFIVDGTYEGGSNLLSVYPNPNDGHFFVRYLAGLPENQNKITIYNFSGKQIFSKELATYEDETEINIRESVPGNYIIVFSSGKNVIASNLFIKK